MRTLRSFLTGALMLVLLGASAAATVAQDEGAAISTDPASVTGTVAPGDIIADGVQTDEGSRGSTEGISFENRWDASDPRLSGTVIYTGNWRSYSPSDVQVESGARILENDGGRWVGTSTAVATPEGNTDTVILRGEGGYEGLTAYVVMDWTARGSFFGAIFPGELPPLPEPPAE